MNVEIAQRLSARRKQSGLSQEALAEKLGVSRQAVSKWERSESSPDTDNLIALAQLYGVSLDELLYVDDEMRDDVAFEAVDRAAERAAATGAPKPAPGTAACATPAAGEGGPETSTSAEGGERAARMLRSRGPPTARSRKCASGWAASTCSTATTTSTFRGATACT